MNFFGEIALPIVLFVIMIGIGFSTKLEDFKSLIKYPKAAILGILSQIVILPLIALGIGWGLNYSDEIVLGLLLLSLCPSGTGSNIITKMVKGNLALSVSLTTVSSLKSLFTIPIIINLYLKEIGGEFKEIELDYPWLILKVFLFTIFPVVLGVIAAEKKPVWVKAAEKPLKWLLPGLLFSVFTAIMFFDEPKNQGAEITDMIIPAILINLVSMLIAFVFVKLFKVESKQAMAIAIESGLKNSAIGLVIATSFLKIGAVELLMLAYSFISFYLTWVIAMVLRRFN